MAIAFTFSGSGSSLMLFSTYTRVISPCFWVRAHLPKSRTFQQSILLWPVLMLSLCAGRPGADWGKFVLIKDRGKEIEKHWHEVGVPFCLYGPSLSACVS
jgi:hypothetical protein